MITPRFLAALYALYGMLAVLLLAVLMPPYQNADEPAHLVRADQISHGGWLARGEPDAPALIDAGILAGVLQFGPLFNHVQPHTSRDLYGPVGWGTRVRAAYPTSAVYPPGFYLPAAAALAVGRRNHLTVLPAIELARAAGGLAAVAVGALAIALAGPAGVWLFAVLTLPMALAQAAAVGQDGLMIAVSGLAAACLVRLQQPSAPHRGLLFATLCVALILVGQARPPYVALAALPLAAGVRRSWRVAGCVAVLAGILAWCVVSLHASGIDVGHFNGADAHAQAMGLLRAPWRLPVLLADTLAACGETYREQFIGVLGWLDVHMPVAYRTAAGVALVWAAACSLLGGRVWLGWRRALLCAGVLLAAMTGVFIMQYLTWSKPGAALVDGVQGRYFLPAAMLAGVLLARRAPGRIGLIAWPVLLFPVATIVVMMHRITLRYYF